MKDNKKPCSKLRKAECADATPDCEWKNGRCKRPVVSKASKDPVSQKKPAACSSLKKQECLVRDVDCVWEKRCKTKRIVIVDKRESVPPPKKSSKKTAAVRQDAFHASRTQSFETIARFVDGLPACITYDPSDGIYRLGSLDVSKQIGSKSVYGAVFLSRFLGLGKTYKVAMKIMKDDKYNRKEVSVLQRVTRMALDGVTPNMPIMYGYRKCHLDVCVRPQVDCPTALLKDPHLMVMNELASGDLKQWISASTAARRPPAEFVSALSQIFMGLAFFQVRVGMIHRDMHWGNALYHSIPQGGWWHYNVAGKDFYVENRGQSWVLWDFGLAAPTPSPVPPQPNKNKLALVNTDFRRVTHAFFSKQRGGWASDMLDPLTEAVSTTVVALLKSKDDATFDFVRVMTKIATMTNGIGLRTSIDADMKVINPRPYVLLV